MADSPLVSVILPTLNGERYLREAIESVLHQSYDNLELIIADNCSTDQTSEIAAEYCSADSRVRCIRHEHHVNLPESLNIGFAQAGGELHTWHSDDNVYRPHAFETMVDALQRLTGFDIVYSGVTFIDEAGNKLQPVRVRPLKELSTMCPIDCSFMYRARVFKELGGYAEDLFLAEDYDFWLRASTLFSFHAIDEDLFLYRRHDASLTVRRGEEARRVAALALSRALPSLHWFDRRDRALAHIRLAHDAMNRGDARALRWNLLNALGRCPLEVAQTWYWNRAMLLRALLPLNWKKATSVAQSRQ